MAFREWLRPSAGVWIGMAAFGAAFGIIPAPVSKPAGWITAVVGLVVMLTLLTLNPPTITVTDTTLKVGRAQLPLTVVSWVDVLDADAMRLAHGRTLDARAFLALRGWVHTGVRVGLADPQDPTPYWLVSSRRPQELAQAVRAGIGGPGAAERERPAGDHASESP